MRALSGILLCSLLYRIYGITADMAYDPIVYAQNAYNLLHGSFSLQDDFVYAHRFPVFVPVSLAFGLLGVDSFSARLWPLLASLVQIVCVYAMGSRLFGQRTGLIATLLIALCPLDVIYAGVLNPDIVLAAFLSLSATLWVLAGSEGARRRDALLFGSGVALATAALTRPYAFLLIFFLLGSWCLERRPRRDLLLGIVGLGLPLLLVGLVYLAQTGDMFYRVRVLSQVYPDQLLRRPNEFGFYPGHLHPQALFWGLHTTGLFAPLWVLALLTTAIRGSRAQGQLTVWFVSFLLFFQFGSMDLYSWVPILKMTRFLTPLVAPGSLLLAALLSKLMEHAWRASLESGARPRFSALLAVGLGALAVVLALDSLRIVHHRRAFHIQRAAHFQALAEAVSAERERPIYFDHWRTALQFSWYLHFERGHQIYTGADDAARMARPSDPESHELRYLNWYEKPSELAECFIILDDEVLAAVAKETPPYRAGQVPGYAYGPPSDWNLEEHSGTLSLYRN